MKSPTLQPLTKLVLLVTIEEGMSEVGKVRPDRARIAARLGIRDPKLINKRWKEAIDAGFLAVVRKAAYGNPAEYEAQLPNRPTVREIWTVQEGPTVRATGDSARGQFTDSTESVHCPQNRDSRGRYCPQITDGSIPETPQVVASGDPISKGAATGKQGRSEATPPEAMQSAPSSSSPVRSGYASPAKCPHGIPNGVEVEPWDKTRRVCARCSIDQAQTRTEVTA